MESADLINISQEALWILIKLSAPILIISLVTGLIVSLFQALTQVQEATLTFVPKLLVIYLSLFFLGSYMTTRLQNFVENIFLIAIVKHD